MLASRRQHSVDSHSALGSRYSSKEGNDVYGDLSQKPVHENSARESRDRSRHGRCLYGAIVAFGAGCVPLGTACNTDGANTSITSRVVMGSINLAVNAFSSWWLRLE